MEEVSKATRDGKINSIRSVLRWIRAPHYSLNMIHFIWLMIQFVAGTSSNSIGTSFCNTFSSIHSRMWLSIWRTTWSTLQVRTIKCSSIIWAPSHETTLNFFQVPWSYGNEFKISTKPTCEIYLLCLPIINCQTWYSMTHIVWVILCILFNVISSILNNSSCCISILK